MRICCHFLLEREINVKRGAISALILVMVVGALAFQYRTDLLLFYVSQQSQPEVGPNVPIQWQRGPDVANLPPAARPLTSYLFWRTILASTI